MYIINFYLIFNLFNNNRFSVRPFQNTRNFSVHTKDLLWTTYWQTQDKTLPFNQLKDD